MLQEGPRKHSKLSFATTARNAMSLAFDKGERHRFAMRKVLLCHEDDAGTSEGCAAEADGGGKLEGMAESGPFDLVTLSTSIPY